MPVVNANKFFNTSDTLVMSLFDSLNKNLFNSALDGITLKLLNGLKTRTAVGITAKLRFHTKTFICMSKTLLEKCTKKQLVESLLYEMVTVYIESKLSDPNFSDDEKAKNFQLLLKRAMAFVNQAFGTSLSFNYSSRAHQTIDSFDEWIDVDDEINFHKFNDTIVCISDDETEDEDDYLEEIRKLGYASVTPITDKINVRDLPDRSWNLLPTERITCCCCTDYNNLFKKCFTGTNIGLVTKETPNISPQKCPICCKTIEKDKLNGHLTNSCNVFHVVKIFF